MSYIWFHVESLMWRLIWFGDFFLPEHNSICHWCATYILSWFPILMWKKDWETSLMHFGIILKLLMFLFDLWLFCMHLHKSNCWVLFSLSTLKSLQWIMFFTLMNAIWSFHYFWQKIMTNNSLDYSWFFYQINIRRVRSLSCNDVRLFWCVNIYICEERAMNMQPYIEDMSWAIHIHVMSIFIFQSTRCYHACSNILTLSFELT